jgi:hypothetical protein
MSFSPTFTTQPGKFFACLPDLVTKWVKFQQLRTPVALLDFVFGDHFTIL